MMNAARRRPAPTTRTLARHVVALLLAGLAGGAVEARTVEGCRFDESVHVGAQALVLNGVGVRGVSIVKGYVMALYVPARSSDAGRLLADPGAKLLDARMLLGTDGATIERALTNGLPRNSSAAELAALAPAIETFRAEMHAGGALRPGDTIQIRYLPAEGTTLKVNGRSLGEPIAGAAFYQALLKIFIGEHVQDARLKAGLLGSSAAM